MSAQNPQVELLYFSDPFCSWCWAMEPVIMRVKETYRDQVVIRPLMGGLVEDMANFLDPLNGISSTADVAPHWEEVGLRTGQPIDGTFMRENQDPHWSTWPACIAVKAAAMQGDALGEAYLRLVRRAAQAEGKNPSDPALYESLADSLAGLDAAAFRQAISDGSAAQAFRDDRRVAAQVGVRSFPTFLAMPADAASKARPVLMGGARDFATFQSLLAQVAPDLQAHAPRGLMELLAENGPMTTRELSEILEKPADALRAELEATEGIRRLSVRKGEFWERGAQTEAPASARFTEIVSWDGEGGMACDMETGICGPAETPRAETSNAGS